MEIRRLCPLGLSNRLSNLLGDGGQRIDGLGYRREQECVLTHLQLNVQHPSWVASRDIVDALLQRG